MRRVVVLLTEREIEALATNRRFVGRQAEETSARHKLRAALDSPPVEERDEHRIYADTAGGGELIGKCANLDEACRRCVGYRNSDSYTNVRIQSRTTTQLSDGSELISPWSDLESEEGTEDDEAWLEQAEAQAEIQADWEGKANG